MKRLKKLRHEKAREEDVLPPPPGWGMIALWGTMFLLVVMVIFNIVPISQGISPLRSRKEKRLLESADALGGNNNWTGAMEIYKGLLEDSRASTKTRVQAALTLHEIYRDKLSSPGLALDAIRDAYLLERDSDRQAALKEQWQKYGSTVGTIDRPFGLPEGVTVIAEVGGDKVTLEEMLLAWKRQNPEAQLTSEAMNKYVQDYMTNALLAEGARIRGDSKKPALLLDLRNLERGTLSREIQISLNKPTDRATVEAFYDQHKGHYLAPDSVALQHIVVREDADITSVTQRLAKEDDFEGLAKAISLDKGNLPNGAELGWMSTEDDFIPNVGIVPGFARRIALKDEGYTTGPLPTQRGKHWFRLQKKRVHEPQPLEEIYARVEKDQRKAAFDSARQELLNELKRTIPMKIYEDKLKEAAEKLKARQETLTKSGAPTPGVSTVEPLLPGTP